MKKLSEYIKDLVIITISISIAFWVENYRESRKDYNDTRALLVKLRWEINSQEKYLNSLIDAAELHSKILDSLMVDLNNCDIEKNQLLADVALAYLPYVTDISETSSFESLKNSGLLSNIKNDSIVIEIFNLKGRIKRNLSEYSEAWKKSQDRVRNLLPGIFENRIKYDFKKSKLLTTNTGTTHLDKEDCAKLSFELTAWITVMKQYSVFIKDHRNAIKNHLIPKLDQEIQ